MEKYTIEKLLDAALDTSSTEYQRLVNAFDGVKADPRAELLWNYAVYRYIVDYNSAADDWGMIPADLNTAGRKAMIEKEVLAIIRDSICTTKNGVEYYRLVDGPTADADLKEMPDLDKILNILGE
jgi:hypothetical protein